MHEPDNAPSRGLRRWWTGLDTGTKAGVISAVLAFVTLIGPAVTWAWHQIRGADVPAAPATTTAPAPTAPGTTAPATTAPAPTASDTGRPLTEIARIGGRIAPLPDEADADRYPGAVVAACPSNQTGDTTTRLVYDLDRRYRRFTATMSGLAGTTEPDAIAVRVSIRTEQVDGTIVTTQQAMVQGVVNQPGQAVEAKVSGADELVLTAECHRPGGVVIMSDPRLHD